MKPQFFFAVFGGYSGCYATHWPCQALDAEGAL